MYLNSYRLCNNVVCDPAASTLFSTMYATYKDDTFLSTVNNSAISTKLFSNILRHLFPNVSASNARDRMYNGIKHVGSHGTHLQFDNILSEAMERSDIIINCYNSDLIHLCKIFDFTLNGHKILIDICISKDMVYTIGVFDAVITPQELGLPITLYNLHLLDLIKPCLGVECKESHPKVKSG